MLANKDNLDLSEKRGDETKAAYKSYLGKEPEPNAMKKLRKYHLELQENKE